MHRVKTERLASVLIEFHPYPVSIYLVITIEIEVISANPRLYIDS